MKAKKGMLLPPWVDTAKGEFEENWMSPCIPFTPVRLSIKDDMFYGVSLSASIFNNGRKDGDSVRLTLDRRGFFVKGGKAVPSWIDKEGIISTDVMPLKKFLESTRVTVDKYVTAFVLNFYENGVDLKLGLSSARPSYDPQIVANVFRGYDKPKPKDYGCKYSAMSFIFNEGAKSFVKWRNGIK